MSQFETKAAAREAIWELLEERKAARFPFPVRGRIPNFAGAREAAESLIEHAIFDGVQTIKCNPDSPQKYLREAALRRGIKILVPTPRLKGGFMLLDPSKIAPENYRDASMLSRMESHVEHVPLDEIPTIDLIVTGCVSVTRSGKRAGKGEGYSDLEAAILCELGHVPVPIVTTVHELQIAEDFPTDPHDIALSVIATPSEIIETSAQVRTHSIAWDSLTEHDLEEMPLLAELLGA